MTSPGNSSIDRDGTISASDSTMRHDARLLARKMASGLLMKSFGIVLGLVAGGVVWLISNTIEMRQQIAVIQSNRFTNKDAAEFMDRIQRLEIAIAKIPTDMPPKWLVDQINRVEQAVDKFNDKVDRITDAKTPIK